MTSQPLQAAVDQAPVTLWNLFTGFLLVGLMGFGGISQSAYYVVVEKRRWLSAKEYLDVFGVCSILPGGNFLNATVMIGDRYKGPIGSIVGLIALMLAPLVILMCIAYGYDSYSYLPDVRAATAGAASAASGLIFGNAIKLSRGAERTLAGLAFGVATFLAVGVFRTPLWIVVVVIVPLAIAVTLWRRGRR